MRVRDLAGPAATVAVGGLAAAATGIALRAAIGHVYGAGAEMDALLVALQTSDALTVPLLWVLSTAVIPIFAQRQVGDPDDAWAFARTVIALAGVAAVALALAVALLAAPVAALAVGRDAPERYALTVSIVPMFALASIFATLTGLFTGLLQARRVFWLPAFALPLRSLVAIVAVLFLPAVAGLWRAVAGIVGGFVVQCAVVASGVLPALLAGGRIRFRHALLGEVARRAAPLLVGSFLFPLHHPPTYRFAAETGEGHVTLVSHAMAVAGVGAGFIGGSLADAAFPRLSESLALADGSATVRHGVTAMLRLSLFLTGALAGVLIGAGPALADAVFAHGDFTREAASVTGGLLRVYGIGLPFLVLPVMLTRVMYAAGDNLLPQVLSIGALVVNGALALVLTPVLGLTGVVIASIGSFAFLTVALGLALWRRHGWIDGPAVAGASARMVLAGGAVTSVTLIAAGQVMELVTRSIAGRAALLAAIGSAAAAGAALAALGLDEFGIRSRVMRRAQES